MPAFVVAFVPTFIITFMLVFIVISCHFPYPFTPLSLSFHTSLCFISHHYVHLILIPDTHFHFLHHHIYSIP